MKGAPLRVAAGVLGGWIVGRIIILSPTAQLPSAIIGPAAWAEAPATPFARPVAHGPLAAPGAAAAPPTRRRAARAQSASTPPDVVTVATSATETTKPQTERATRVERSASPPLTPQPMAGAPTHSRLSVDAWLVLRQGGGQALPFGQLGASQGGVRLTYALDDERRLALSARADSPVQGGGGEVGIGLDVRPTRLPIHLLVEERVGRGAPRPAVVAISGASVAAPAGLRVDAYAQAGAVSRRGGFIDGAALVSRPLLEHGRTGLELGGGAWGAAQRGLGRLDVGPSVALVAPTGGTTLRLQLDYRFRVLGHAQPGSGPVLTLGGSF